MNPLVRDLFVRVIIHRMGTENRTAEDIIQEYVKLTTDEKREILSAIGAA